MRKETNLEGNNMLHPKLLKMSSLCLFALGSILLLNMGCSKEEFVPESSAVKSMDDLRLHYSNFGTINLVSDVDEYAPVFIDANLKNAWGLAFSDEGSAWVSCTEAGVTTVYDSEGMTLLAPVNIPFAGDPTGGNPTGVIYNETSTFIIPETGEKSEFIYATENGTIVAWSSGASGYVVADRSAAGAVYKGVEITKTASGINYLYATDFKNRRVDVYDQNFVYQAAVQFVDPTMPENFAPFNIKAIDGKLYVTYAKQLAPENTDDEPGPGNGYVNVFMPNGTFVERFASNGTLNSPWGIEQTQGMQKAILIGNFGNGRINVFTSAGTFKSFLRNESGAQVEIEGLWAIEFPRGNLVGDANNRLYFTAGPDDEEHGVFGYLNPAE